jgi:hypothetical protein
MAWADLRHLFAKDWVKRVWTYQEILLASHPVVVCGHAHLSWSDLKASLLFLRHVQSGQVRGIVTPWLDIVLDRKRLKDSSTSVSTSTSSASQQYETFVEQILVARQFFRKAAPWIIYLIGVSIIASGMALSILVSGLKSDTIGILVGVGGGVFVAFSCIVCQVTAVKRNDFAPSKIRASTSDGLVGGLYRRYATNPMDMAYGVWAILKQRGAIDVQEPTYERDINQTYWMLTVYLIQATTSLEILPLAAARGLPAGGFPSWVPDWSPNAKEEHKLSTNLVHVEWDMIEPDLSPTEFVGRTRYNESGEKIMRLDEQHRVLTVRAQELATIGYCAAFQRTSDTYRAAEKEMHSANLSSMLKMLEFRGWRWLHAKHLLASFGVNATAWPPTKQLDKWEKQYHNHQHGLGTFMRLWLNGEPDDAPPWFPEFLCAQIAMCNLLAAQKRNVCCGIRDGAHIRGVTSCSLEAQVDDRLLRIWGLPEVLVVRRLCGEGNRVKIVGLVSFDDGGGPMYQDRGFNARKDRFTDFQIY